VAGGLSWQDGSVRALVTGGAGFIGSTLVDRLLADGAGVVVLDDLSTGYADNVSSHADLRQGDVGDLDAVRSAVAGCDLVFHQAAARSVLRSVHDPIGTNRVNVEGTLNVLVAARDAGVRRVVSASSSSVYGGATQLPTPETAPTMPRSPYAVAKLIGEHNSRIFYELYGLETVSLRYFNVYGPRQRPDSAYAAVIPLFIDALACGRRPEVHGDGLQSRSFSYVSDVVQANMLAATAAADRCAGKAYNIAAEGSHSLIDILGLLGTLLDVTPDPQHTETRAGDVRVSWADCSAAATDLDFTAAVSFADGLRRTVEAYRTRQAASTS
jgi:UDP-glucose 4-epimerase